MLPELQKVIRLLMVLCKRNQPQRGGGLLVLLCTQFSSTETQLTCTVAAAGKGFVRIARHRQMAEALEILPSFISVCECPCQEELYKFSENVGSLHFTCSFQVDQGSQDVESKIERFLQRVSLVNSQVEIIFQVKKNEITQQQIFSSKSRCLMDYFIAKDCAAFIQSTFSVGCLPSCCQMHLVFGEKLHLLLPFEAVEAGLYGEISLTCLATLGPCMNRYPNWPARLSHINVLAYGPSGIPIMRGEEQTQLSFIQSLADLTFWRKLGLTGVHCAYTDTAQGSQFYEVEFSTEDEHHPDTEPAQSQAVSEDSESEVPAVEQTITVLLLFQHSDPFHSQLFDFISSEEILERQLDSVLWCNAEKVRLALQSLLENTLKGFLNRKKFREKLQTTMPVIVDSVSSIVSSSSNAEFRSACLSSMKVQNTTDLPVALHQNLQRVISSRVVSGSHCTAGKSVEAAVSEQNDRENVEEDCDQPDFSGKRSEREVEECPVISKRSFSWTMDEDLESSESSWAAMDTQMNPQSSSQQSLTPDIDSQSITNQINQQVEREWLVELENLSDWD